MKKYSETHEWVECTHSHAKVGITKVALEEIGEVVFIELPRVGSHLQKGDVACVLESTKAAIDVMCPLSGVVKEVNTLVSDNLDLLNRSSEESGWLFQLELTHPEEQDALFEEKDYYNMVKKSAS